MHVFVAYLSLPLPSSVVFIGIFEFLYDCVKWVVLLRITVILLKMYLFHILAYTHHGGVGIRGQPERVGCLLPRGSQSLNSGC